MEPRQRADDLPPHLAIIPWATSPPWSPPSLRFIRNLQRVRTYPLYPETTRLMNVRRRHLLPDPTLFESQLCPSHITVALSSAPLSPSGADLLQVYQAGAPLSTAGVVAAAGKDTLKRCVKMARERAGELKVILEG